MSKAIGRDNIYREITDKIIAEFERGIVPWVQPWTSGKQSCPLGLPLNGLTRRNYSGINILLLWSVLEEKGFASPHWLTFKQSVAMGASVRKGEHGTHVYFADKFVPQKEQQRAKDEGTDPSAIHFLKRYTVFNAEQCEGLSVGLFGKVEPLSPREIVPEAEALIGATGGVNSLVDCTFGFKCPSVCIRTPPKRVADILSFAPHLCTPVSRRQLDDHGHSCALLSKVVCDMCAAREQNKYKRREIERKKCTRSRLFARV